MNARLQISELRVELGEFRLGPLSLCLPANGYLVLLGPSGCGKTSLLRTIAGIHAAPPRTLLLDGKDIAGLPPHRRGIGYVDQHVDLFPHMDVAKNVAFGLGYLDATPGEQHAAFDRIISLLGLGALAHRKPATLSGGESRRVSLARSLVVGPRILLLDEPLSMLDQNAREEMLDVLTAIHRELGTATIHVTHDRDEAWRIGGSCAVMHAGMIEQSGSVEDLFRRPAGSRVARFLGGSNIFPAKFERIGGAGSAVLDWARFDLAAPAPFESGFIHIRPETLSPVSGPGPDTVAATVVSRIDRGIYAELKVRVKDGATLVVHMTGHDDIKPGAAAFFECRMPPHPMRE